MKLMKQNRDFFLLEIVEERRGKKPSFYHYNVKFFNVKDNNPYIILKQKMSKHVQF